MINLDEVLTFTEAAEKWGFSNGATIRKAVERNKFKIEEVKKSGNVWLTTYDAMERVFGLPNIKGETFIVSYDELNELIYYLFDRDREELAIKRIDEIVSNSLEALNKGDYVKVVTKRKCEDKVICIFKEKEEFLGFFRRIRHYMGMEKILKKYEK